MDSPLGKKPLTLTTTLTLPPPPFTGVPGLVAGAIILSLARNDGLDAVDLTPATDADVKDAMLGAKLPYSVG